MAKLLQTMLLWTIAFAMASASVCRAQVKHSFYEPVKPPRQQQMVQAGGLHSLAPPHTTAAVMACADDYIEWVAVAVRRSHDGVHVLGCDEVVQQATGSPTSHLRDMTWGELQQLDCGSLYSDRTPGMRLSSLTDLLDASRHRVNLQLDCEDVSPEQLANEILSAKMEQQVIVAGDPMFLEQLRATSGNRIATLFQYSPEVQNPGAENLPRDAIDELVQRVAPVVVEIAAERLTLQLCQAFQARGIQVQVNLLSPTAEHPELWQQVLAMEPDLIKTNHALDVRFADAQRRYGTFPVRIAWHRGASRYAPENTLAAIAQAVALRADFVELDVRTTQDGRYVLLHDPTVDRTSSGHGPVAELTLDQLATLDAGAWFSTSQAGARIPNLSTSLEALGQWTQLYLDAKDITPQAVVDHLRAHKLLERHVVYQSLEYCRQLKALEPTVRTLPPLRRAADLEQALAIQPFGLDVAWEALSPGLIARCHAAGVLVFSDAMGSHETLEDYLWAIVAGIDVIQTDFPLRLLRAQELHAAMKPAESRPPRIIAHRGGVVDQTLIENNLPAIAESRRRGYYMLEVDIRESLDGHLVVHHDANFTRFYGDERQVADLTWAQIEQIRAATGERPIDFAQFADACRGDIQLMLDVKGPEHSEAFFQEMERILRSNGLLESAMVIGTSQAKSYFLGKAKVGLNLPALLAAEDAGEPVGERYFLFEHGEDLDEAKVAEALRLGVTVVPSINIFHYAGDGNHWLLARRDIRRLRTQGIEYFQIDSVYEDFVRHAPTHAAESLRFNELQAIGTHNSYHVAMSHAALSLVEKRSRPLAQSLDYSHLPLGEQLEVLGMRQLELDLFADPEGGKYAQPRARQLAIAAGLDAGPEHDPQGELQQPGLKVLHVQDIDYQTRALTFVAALREVREWSQAHPWHVPVLILVEAKDQSIGEEFTQPVPFDEAMLRTIDAEVQSVFGLQELITPDLVRGEFATLRDAVLSRGWPALEAVRGKVLFALDNEGEIRDRYLANSPTLQGKLLFVSVDETHPAAAFRKINDPIANFDKIRTAVQQGFLVRTRADSDTRQARQNDSTQRERALASGAQYISTDYPVPDQRFSSYRVALPGQATARPNPVNAQAIHPSRDLDK